jgi:hypothetical protein
MQVHIVRIFNTCIFSIQMEHWWNEIPQLSRPSIDYSLNTMLVSCKCNYFHLGITSGFCKQNPREMQYSQFFSFEHCNGKMGGVNRINDQASRYGWLVSGMYLPRWLVGMKVKWRVFSQRYLKTQFEAQAFCVFPCNLFFLAAYNLAIVQILCETNLCT